MTLDSRRTGWTVEKCVTECVDRYGDDPYRQAYYTTYSDIYHTDPDCRYLDGSESLHYGGSKYDFNVPNCTGDSRTPWDLEECSWCAGRYHLKYADQHVPRILNGEKHRTVRLSGYAWDLPEGDTLVLRDEDGLKVGTAPIEAVRETTVEAFVRDGPAGHVAYSSVAEFVAQMNEYYPNETVTAETTVVDVAWGDLTPATDQRSVVGVSPLVEEAKA